MSNRTNYYNILIDSGLWNGSGTKPTSVTITPTIWTNAVNACVDSSTYRYLATLYFPGGVKYVFTGTNNQIKTNLQIEGDGRTSLIAFDNSFSGGVTGSTATSDNDNIFISIGHTNWSFKSLGFTGNAKHINSLIKINTYLTTSNIARNIELRDLYFTDCWVRACVKGAETDNGDTHRLERFIVRDIYAERIGNPAAPYVIQEGADNDYAHVFDLGGTTATADMENIWALNIAGTVINGFGDPQSTTVMPQYIGHYIIKDVHAENCNGVITSFGNHPRYCIMLDNIISVNHTGIFAISVNGTGCVGTNINITAYNGINCIEWRGQNNKLSADITCYVGARPTGAKLNDIQGFSPEPTTKQTYASNFVLTTGFDNRYSIRGTYDYSYTKSAACPDRMCGVHIVGQDSPSTQPTTWNGRSNYYGHYFSDCIFNNCTGPGWLAEIYRVDDVYIDKSCVFRSNVMNEDAVRIAGKRWYVDALFDSTGSTNTSVGAISVNTNQAGTDYNDSVVSPITIGMTLANRIKNRNLYKFKLN